LISQIGSSDGETVKQGRGTATSWMKDGSACGVEKILNSKVAYAVDMKQPKPPLNELNELKEAVLTGKFNNRISAILREQRKKEASEA
jgi:hypothetical protein